MSNSFTSVQNGFTTTLTESAIENFQTRFRGPIIDQQHAEFNSTRQLWNKMIDKKPGMIARCMGVADVIEAVNFARENKLLVAVRGAGHGVAGLAMNDGGLVIDLSLMRAVWVDPAKKTAKVQGGATWLDVDRETQVFGLACPGGVVSDTGVAGLTLGGGLSWMRRKTGMSIDKLIGADMVLADGRFVHVNAEENADLFWAIRGGGGNFGIVTSFEFQLMELGPEVMMAACMYPRAEAEKAMKFWVEYTRTAPDEITSDCIHWAVPAHPTFPEELHGKPITILAGMYAGPPEKGQKMLQPLREVAEPLLDLSNIYPYTAVQQMFDSILPKQALNCYWKSLYLDDIPPALQNRIIEWAANFPALEALISIRNLQGAISRVPAKATAFGDRSARFLLSIDTMWYDPAQNEANIQWTRDFFQDMLQESKGQVYFNFNSDMEGPSDIIRDSFGANYDRLVEIKTKYDPENLFRLNQNIKPRKMVS